MGKSNVTDLIKRCSAGDSLAAGELVQTVQDRVYYHCLKMLKNREDAMDAAQDTLVAMLTGLNSLREPAAFWGWLSSITANQCRLFIRRSGREVSMPEDEEGNSMLDQMEDLDEQTIPDKALDNEETRRMIVELVDALPDAQRECVLMYYYEELSVKDIAAAEQVSEGTVKSRLNYARKAIRQGVEQYARQGLRLYGLSPLPLLLYFLRKDAALSGLGASAAAELAQSALAASGAALGAAAGTTAGASAAAGAAAADGAAASAGAVGAAAGTAAKAAAVGGAKLLSGKAAAALAGIVLAGGVTVGGVLLHEKPPAPTPTPPPAAEVIVPTVVPTPTPTPEPEVTPLPSPSPSPTPSPSPKPSPKPTPIPSPSPTPSPIPSPSPVPSPTPVPVPTPAPSPEPEVQVEQKSCTLERGENAYFPGVWSVMYVSSDSLQYSSSDTSVVDFNARGQFTGMAPGTAVLTATSPEDPALRMELLVTVSSRLHWDPTISNEQVPAGQSRYHSASPVGYYAELSYSHADWVSSDPSVLTVAPADNSDVPSLMLNGITQGTATVTGTIYLTADTCNGPVTMTDTLVFTVEVI